MPKQFEISPDVRHVTDRDGTTLLDVKKGVYYAVNSVAARIWSLLVEKLDVEQIAEHLGNEFDVPREQIRKDIATFVGTLTERGLIYVRH